MRIDTYLFENKLTSSRTRAANLIALGRVVVNGKTISKASTDVTNEDEVQINEDYSASLGGLKLEHALRAFAASPEQKICLDVGASNGGFTDILLNNGAKIVYAVDVGECALPERLTQNARVVVMDRTNARFLNQDSFQILPEFAVIDVSFISLTLILPAVHASIVDGGEVIALIKPQFESEKRDLTKKGLVREEKVRLKAVKKVHDFAQLIGFVPKAPIEAPHPFLEKNQEYLIYMQKKSLVK